jgi:Ca2+-binding RTX toxin-like protein
MHRLVRKNGTSGDDTYYAVNIDDYVYYAKAGHDNVVTLDGNDKLFGQAGLDLLGGGKGNDLLRGGSDADNLKGEEGDDRLFGDGGNDMLYAGMDRDILTGGKGRDVFVFITENLTGRGSDIDIVKDFTVDGRNADFLGLAVAGLDGEHIANLKQLRPYMSQEGSDVHISFETADMMILEDVRLKQLTGENFLFEPSLAS